MKFPFLLLAIALAVGSSRFASAEPPAARALREAMARKDVAAVRAVVAETRAQIGRKAGEPEVPDTWQPIPADARWLSPVEAQPGFTPKLAELEQLATWRIGLDPRTMTQPLRTPASVMSGCVATCQARLDGAEPCEKIARETAAFLIWAQEQAGAGLFPFPAARRTSSARAMEVATRFLERAERAGQLDRITKNNWIFDDLGDGGLQFDNGECGVAMFEFYEWTRDQRHLASARRAADWALQQPLCSNWNYNSFSVWLLAKAAAVTGEHSYRDAALEKARLGVIPGQLTDGPHTGRWVDPHNARPAYHYIMLRALAQLAAVLPAGPDREEAMRALTLGLRTRNAEIISQGAMTKEKAMDALLLVDRLFPRDDAFLRDTQSTAALQALGQLVSDQARRGGNPLAPRDWGLFLAAAKTRGSL